MQKEKLKQNGNHVGANCVRPHFEDIAKNKKGITLVALVITIIVMLILVGVTVSVSLNGGLFTTATEASAQVQIEVEKEQLLTAALGAIGIDGKVNFDNLDNGLPDNFTKIVDKTYESSTGNKYKVTEDGEVILLDENEEEEKPVTPTITITPETITGEIESGATGTEVGTITATLNNEEGELQWSITPTNSGLELVDTDNANVKKIKASKAVENATITVSYGSVSDTCSITVTEKEPEMITFYIGEDEYTVEQGTDWATWIEEEGKQYGFRASYLPNGTGLVLYDLQSTGSIESPGLSPDPESSTFTVIYPTGTNVSPNEQISALHYLLVLE